VTKITVYLEEHIVEYCKKYRNDIAILTWKKVLPISIVILFPPSIAIAIAIFSASIANNPGRMDTNVKSQPACRYLRWIFADGQTFVTTCRCCGFYKVIRNPSSIIIIIITSSSSSRPTVTVRTLNLPSRCLRFDTRSFETLSSGCYLDGWLSADW